MGDRLGEAVALVNLGSLQTLLGDKTAALDLLSLSAGISQTIGARHQLGFAQHEIAMLLAQGGEPGEAHRWFDAALATRRATGYRPGIATTMSEIGPLLARLGRRDDGIASLREAGDLCHVLELAPLGAVVSCRLAALGAATAADASEAFARAEARLPHHDRLECRLLLWRLTGDAAHLAAARAIDQEILGRAPAACRESMLANVALHREVAAAAGADA
jgi:hypothetical protein